MDLINGLIWMPRIADHIIPIWEKIPQHLRGTLWVRDQYYRKVKYKYPEVKELALFKRYQGRKMLQDNNGPVIVANEAAYREVQRAGLKSIITTHCCGETLGAPKVSMPGYLRKGVGSPENVLLFLAPGYHIAEIFKANNPDTLVKIIGSPKLDPWHKNFKKPENPKPKVVISFTWNWQDSQWGKWATKIKGAWDFYKNIIPTLKSKDWDLYGNAHPKMERIAHPYFISKGIPVIEDFSEVLNTADLYICDYSSTIFEFASTGRPVILLNSPWNDREYNMGLRYWKAADVGIQVDKKEELKEKIRLALEDPLEVREKRKEVIDYVYPYRKGSSGKRAAKIIQKVFEKNYEITELHNQNKMVWVTAEKELVIGSKYYSKGKEFIIEKERAIALYKKGAVTISN